jgi:hypothetical protein
MRLPLTVLFAFFAAAPAWAACPPPVAGDTPAVIEANQQRLVCLQRELSQKTEIDAQKFEIDMLNRAVDDIRLQQRFDKLDFSVPTF